MAPMSGLTGFYASQDWFNLLAAHARPAGTIACPLLLRVAGAPVALLPLWRQGRALSSQTTVYSALYQPLILAEATPDAMWQAGRALGRFWKGGWGHGCIRLDALPEESQVLAALLTGARQAGLRVRRFAHFGNWHAPVAGLSWAAYLASRPGALRETVRRRLRQAARDPTIAIEIVREPADLALALAAYAQIYARSWKQPEPYPDFIPALARLAAERGILRLGVLRVAGQPAAAQLWIVADGEASVLKLAHDEAFAAHSPGTVLTARMIQHLLDSERINELDFGRGDDPYKQLWTTRRRQRVGVLLIDAWQPAGLATLLRHDLGQLWGQLWGQLRNRLRNRLRRRRLGT